jgi:formate dehydrogenase subunit beta
MKDAFYIAWSSDEAIRKRGASGGAVTALLKVALETKTVDAALVVKKRNGSRYDGILSLVTDPQGLAGSAGTMHFAPVNIATEIKKYLGGAQGLKMAVTCKPCDCRAIIELAKRGQVAMDHLLLIGVNCTGTFLPAAARKMIKEEYGVHPDNVVGEDVDKGRFVITTADGRTIERDLEELEEKGYGRRDNCRRCTFNIPRMADLACGKWGATDAQTTFIEVCSQQGSALMDQAIRAGAIVVEKPEEQAVKVRQEEDKRAVEEAIRWQEKDLDVLRLLPHEERLNYWFKYFDRCIKCFGCRDACPLCYCQECYLEAGRGFLHGGEIPPHMTFPLIRLAHVADSCVNCGQCQDTCPMEIPLTKLFQMLNRELSSLFDYVPGMTVEDIPPLTTVSDEEVQVEAVNVLRKA